MNIDHFQLRPTTLTDFQYCLVLHRFISHCIDFAINTILLYCSVKVDGVNMEICGFINEPLNPSQENADSIKSLLIALLRTV